MLLVAILCRTSLAIKADARLCLGNKIVDTPIVGDLDPSGTFPWFSGRAACDQSFLPFTGLILSELSSHAVNPAQQGHAQDTLSTTVVIMTLLFS